VRRRRRLPASLASTLPGRSNLAAYALVVPAEQELTADAVPDDTLDTVEAGLDEVELALARLDAGTHGLCEHCGAQLPEGVLAVAPTTRRCEACPP
jgi:RNA polymerase-binding transcription factor DksA